MVRESSTRPCVLESYGAWRWLVVGNLINAEDIQVERLTRKLVLSCHPNLQEAALHARRCDTAVAVRVKGEENAGTWQRKPFIATDEGGTNTSLNPYTKAYAILIILCTRPSSSDVFVPLMPISLWSGLKRRCNVRWQSLKEKKNTTGRMLYLQKVSPHLCNRNRGLSLFEIFKWGRGMVKEFLNTLLRR